MPQNNPNDLQDMIRVEIGQLANHIGGVFGQEVGLLQKQLNNLAGLDLAQLTVVQNQVQALYAVLDGNPALPGFQNLQNLLDLIDRVVAIEAAQAATAAELVNLADGIANVDDRLTTLETGTTQQLADIAADVATANATATSAQSSANAANAAIAVLSDREDNRHNQHEGRHNGHDNSIGLLRTHVFLGHVGLAAVAIAGFNGAFSSAKAAALL
jgi:hypothetical protein